MTILRKIYLAIFKLIIVCSISLLFSCKNKANPHYPKSYIGKEINLPHELLDKCCEKEMIFLVYYDLKECFNCQVKEFQLWNDFLMALDASIEEGKDSLEVVFIENISKDDRISDINSVLQDIYPIIIYYDPENEFERNNDIPLNDQYRCFLLDENRKIRLIGKPIFNSVLFDKYLNKISTEQNN